MSQASPVMQLIELGVGYWKSQAVYVAAKLGLADLLAAGPRTAEDLAAATETHPQALYRLLRALASIGVFAEDGSRRFSLTPVAELLRQDVPGSQRAMVIMLGEEHFQAWGELLYSVTTGKRGWDKIFHVGPFDYLAAHPEQAAIFDEAMVSVHGRETAVFLDAYDLSQFKTVIDIGGGNGSVLSAVLERHPNVNGVLFDLPNVIARAKPRVEAAGVADRCRLVAGSFFESVPGGCDAYMMRHIIHDWTDEECTVILRNIHRAMPDEGRLLVVESVIPPGNDPFFGKLLDLNMLVIPGGRERTAEEYEVLYSAAGFRLQRIVPTASEVSVIEGVKR